MTGGHNKVEYCSGSHLRESSFRSIDLSWAAGLSLRRGLKYTVCCATDSIIVLIGPPEESLTKLELSLLIAALFVVYLHS